MDTKPIKFCNFNLVSYNRFDSSEENDDRDEKKLVTQRIRTSSSGGNISGNRYYRFATVILTMLCIFLISAVSVLWVKFNNMNTHNTKLQSYNSKLENMTAERNQTVYNNLTLERDQLQTSYNNMTAERDRLQANYNNLTVERDQLQIRNKELINEKGQLETSNKFLTVERDQLQTTYNNLTVEKDQLQASNKILVAEKDRLETRNNLLTIEKNWLETSYNNLTIERDDLINNNKILTLEKDRLQNSYNNLTTERDHLQASYNNLTMIGDQVKCKDLANEMEKLHTNYSTMANQKDQLQKEKDEVQNRLEQIFAESKLGWIYFNSSLYFLSTEVKSWNEARQDCKRRGADLVTIKTKEKQEFLLNKLGNDKAWIGLHDKVTEGIWKWVDDTVLSMIKFWAPGEPNNEGNEDCAELWGFQGKNGWNDGPCKNKAKWICEKPVSW